MHNENTRRREKGTEKISEAMMTENFMKLMLDIKPNIQKSQGTASKINAKKSTPRHITFRLHKIKDKEKILKETKRKKLLYL